MLNLLRNLTHFIGRRKILWWGAVVSSPLACVVGAECIEGIVCLFHNFYQWKRVFIWSKDYVLVASICSQIFPISSM
jgi:hypothetical protein